MPLLNGFQLFIRHALLYPLSSPFLPPVNKVQLGYSYAAGNLEGTLSGGGGGPDFFTRAFADLPQQVGQSSVAVDDTNGKLYLPAHNVNSVLQADIASPLDWTENPLSGSPGQISRAIIVGSYIYYFTDGSQILRADLTDPFTTTDVTTNYPAGSDYATYLRIGDTLYLFGGFNGAALDTVWSADAADPTDWTEHTNALAIAVDWPSMAVIDDFIYIFGGGTDDNPTDHIQRAPLSDPLDWSDLGALLPLPVGYSQQNPIIWNDRIYLIGGIRTNEFLPSSEILSAPTSDPTDWIEESFSFPNDVVIGIVYQDDTHLYLYNISADFQSSIQGVAPA